VSPPEPISKAIEKPVGAVSAVTPTKQGQEPGFELWRVPFKGRHVDVGLHPRHGLFVIDPAGQVKLPAERVRLYRAKTNKLVVVAKWDLVELQKPKSEKQAFLAARGYAAFLNPSLERPASLDAETNNQPFNQNQYKTKELTPLDVKMREDMKELAREMTESTGEYHWVAEPSERSPFWSVQCKSRAGHDNRDD